MTQYLFIIMILIGAGYARYYGRKAKIEIEEFNQKKINQKRVEKK